MDRIKTIQLNAKMITLGILTTNALTAITGSVEQANGQIEKDVIGVVAGDVFQATAIALTDAAMVRAKEIRIYTNDAQLLKFLTPPICVKPTGTTFVKGWGKVPTGGDPNQWEILYKLFACGRWQIRQAPKLPGTEAIYHEYCKSNAATGASDKTANGQRVPGCYRRLYEGVWADA